MVKGTMSVDKWGPFSFSLMGKNPEERGKIADFVRPYYFSSRRVVPIKGHPDDFGLSHVDFLASLEFTLGGAKKAEIDIGIMPPDKLKKGINLVPSNQEKIRVRGEFHCQYSGPLSLVLLGSNAREQSKLIAWLRSYLKKGRDEEFAVIRDMFGRGCLTIWFSNKDQTEADIKVTVIPSLQFMKSVQAAR